jgi:hypothetical protein
MKDLTIARGTIMADEALRSHLVQLLTWHDAHVSFEGAVKGLSPTLRGVQPPGVPYSPWQLLEHLRLTQLDILDFCRNPAYQEPSWPDDYWPKSAEPPTEEAWDGSVASYLQDRAAIVQLAEDPAVDLFAVIPHGTGQTYLRELLLVADHNSYHVGELVLVRRLLGSWPPSSS